MHHHIFSPFKVPMDPYFQVLILASQIRHYKAVFLGVDAGFLIGRINFDH